jgi:signal transduction histidine kinase
MKNLFLIVSIFFSLTVSAQKQGKELADSLIIELPNAVNDTARARLLNKIVTFYATYNTDTALNYADAGMLLAKKMNWSRAINTFNTCYGTIYSTKGMYDTVMFFYRQSLAISIKEKDSVNISVAYNNLGSTAFAKGDFVDAANYFMLTLKISELINYNHLRGIALENIGNVYYNQEDYTRSLQYARQSLKVRQEDKDEEGFVPSCLKLIGMNYTGLKKYDSSKKYFDAGLAMCRRLGDKSGEAIILTNYASMFSYQKDYVKAVEYALNAKSIWDEVDPNFETALDNTGGLGSYYLQMAKIADTQKLISVKPLSLTKNGLLQAAKKYLEEAAQQSKVQKNHSIYTSALAALAETNSMLGDYKNAYTNHVRYTEMQDSIYSQENKNKIAAATSQLEIDKKNSELALKNLTINTQQKQRIFYIAGIAALAIIGGLLFHQSHTRKKTNTTLMVLNNQLDDANKVKARFFAILSHDLRSPVANLVNFLHLQKNEPEMFDKEQADVHQQKISSSAENLLETMEAMLLWSKGQMENFKPEIKQVAVNDLFSYLQKFFASTENVKFNFINTTNAIVTTDENYLQTIMHNLTANAVKALKNNPNGFIEWAVEQNGDKTHLSITDNGPGVQDEQLKALYDDTVVANSKTGLGLHLIRDLAKAIQCKISIQTNQYQGTTFLLSV